MFDIIRSLPFSSLLLTMLAQGLQVIIPILMNLGLSGLYGATAKLFIPKVASLSLNVLFVSIRNDTFMTCVGTSPDTTVNMAN